MARAKVVTDGEGRFYGIRIKCPGCVLDRCGHGAVVLPTDWTPPNYERSPYISSEVWRFNGDLESPTFSPSVLTTANYGEERREVRCHSFVTNGRIQYLSDCTHALANQTVDLPEVEP